jgi:hypothetical protein
MNNAIQNAFGIESVFPWLSILYISNGDPFGGLKKLYAPFCGICNTTDIYFFPLYKITA